MLFISITLICSPEMNSLINIGNKSEIIELLFNSMPFSYVFWKDINGVYMGANTNQVKLFGHAGKEFLGKNIFQILDDYNSAKSIDDIDNKIMREGISTIIEEQITTPQGEQKVFLSQKQPIRDSNNVIIGLLGFSVDITERKKMEEELRLAKELAEAANQAKTEFLENMRHDIRTPLTGIVGFSDILSIEFDDPRIREYTDNLVASSHALLDFMDEVLEAVRVSSGDVPILKKKFNLSQVVEQVVALYLAKAHEKRVQLTLELDKKLPHFIIGDKIRFHRIALELISNALNFTDKGYVTLSIELVKRDNQKLVIKMTVTDSGIGIPKDKQQDIYVQFKRLTPSYQGIYKGSGLGLYIVKQFIDELGGEIYVESQPNQGTCFTCLMPFQEPLLDDDSGIDQADDLNIEKRFMMSKTNQLKPSSIDSQKDAITNVLVVEDNPIAQMAAKCILSAMACHVDIASNGNDALILCETHRYDLIFMDIGLGDGIDGYEVTHHIRKHQEIIHTPIIALTAHAADENKQRCIEAGMDAVLTKPLTQIQAADILKSFIPARLRIRMKLNSDSHVS